MIQTLGEYLRTAVLQDFSIANYEKLWCYEFLYRWAVKEIVLDNKLPITLSDQAALYMLLQDFSETSLNERYEIFKRVKNSEKKDWHRTALDMAREYAKAASPFYAEKYTKVNNMNGCRCLNSESSKPVMANDPTLVLLFIDSSNLFTSGHFNNCVNLRQVVFSNCSGLEPNMFLGCNSLQRVYLYNTTCMGELNLPSGCELIDCSKQAVEVDSPKLAELEAQLAQVKENLNGKLNIIKEQSTQISDLQAALKDQKATDELEAKLKEAEAKLASAVTQDKLDELVKKYADTSMSLSATQQERDTAQRELAEVKERLKTQQEQYKQAYVEHDALKEENAHLSADLEAKAEEHNAYVDEASKLIHSLEDEVAALTAKVASYENKSMPDMTNFPNLRMYCSDKMIAAFYAYFGDNGFYAWADKQEAALATGYKPEHYDELPAETQYRARYNFNTKYPLADKFFDVPTVLACMKADASYEDTVFKALYEKACVLYYKFGVQEAKGANIDELLQHHSATKPITTEEGYIRAMNTLKNLLEEGKLSKRHLDAIRELVKDTDTKADKREEIMQTIEKHGYTESDYPELYDECLHSIPPTEVKYTLPEDMDTLISERMDGYLSGGRVEKPEPTIQDIEVAIRETLNLSDDEDITPYMEQVKAYALVFGGQFDSELECMLDCARKYITKRG